MVPIPAIKKGTDTCRIVWYHFSFLISPLSPFESLRSVSGSKTELDEIVTMELPLERDPFSPTGISFLSSLPDVFKPAVNGIGTC